MPQYDADRDLRVLTAMADQVERYLIEDELLWPLEGRIPGGMPRLTLGGYLLRRHRLAALRGSLTDRQQAALDEALAVFRTAIQEWTIHYFNKIDREWDMRINLLENFLRDVNDVDVHDSIENWPNQARQRTMLHLLLEEIRRRDPKPAEKETSLARLDQGIRRYLRAGETGSFLWAAELETVYPREPFWWLWVVPQEDSA